MARRARQAIEYRLYELNLDFPVLLLDGKNWRISEVKSSRLHFHNCLEIGICHADSGTLMLRDDPLEFRAGDVTCIPRYVPHTTFSAAGESSLWSYIFVDLRELLYGMVHSSEDLDLSSLSTPDFRCIMSRDEFPRVYFLTKSILEELREKKKNYQTVVKALFMALYYELMRTRDTLEHRGGEFGPRRDTLVLTPALNYINDNYMNKVTIEQLAGMCHLSTTHFRRLFLAIMGTSPLNYVNSTRIDRACILLKTTDSAIIEVAEATGFSAISSFNRCFANIMGVSPREYRNPEIRGNVKPKHKYILQYSGWFEPEP